MTPARRIRPPRVLDATALVSLFSGVRSMMKMLDEAESGGVFLLMPSAAIAEAEAVVGAGARLWDPFLLFRGIRAMELTEHTAIEVGRIMRERRTQMSPVMVGQVEYEAKAMNAVIVTRVPSAYEGRGVTIMSV